MIADIEANKKIKSHGYWIFLRGRKLNISLVFILQSYPKRDTLKEKNQRELQKIASNHSFDIEFRDFINLYKDYTK